MAFKSQEKKRAFHAGLIAGSRKQDQNKLNKKAKVRLVKKPVYLGPCYVNGKFYDTNWKKPVLIPEASLKIIYEDYQPEGGHLSKKKLVECYLHHMRIKFGHFDENGNFLGYLGDYE